MTTSKNQMFWTEYNFALECFHGQPGYMGIQEFPCPDQMKLEFITFFNFCKFWAETPTETAFCYYKLKELLQYDYHSDNNQWKLDIKKQIEQWIHSDSINSII